MIGEVRMLDKLLGGLFGVAIGDALGATTEFMSKDQITGKYGSVTEIIGGGYWEVEPGETTDDTAMTIAVAKGIIANSADPIEEIGKQFMQWKQTNPKDIGITIRHVFDSYQGDWFTAAQKTHYALDEMSAGNGSLMRCLPIALAYSDLNCIEELTVKQSQMTHYDDLAAEACLIYNRIAHRLLSGEELQSSILTEIMQTRYEKNAAAQPDCPPDGFVVHTMKWVLYWLLNGKTFDEVVINAANMGGDSDTIAAIAGGLKGIEVGFHRLPEHLSEKLLDGEILKVLGRVMFELRDQDTLFLKENTGVYLTELEGLANELGNLVELKQPTAACKDQIKENIYRSSIFFLKEDDRFFTWRMAENRFKRTERLLDLGAPIIIILNEIRWLKIMTNHLNKWYKGIKPAFTQDERDELDNER